MPDDLTDADLAAIEARADAATVGPWKASIEGRDHDSGDDFILTGDLDDDALDMYVTLSYRVGAVMPAPAADLDFIAGARQDIPRLIAEVRRLRAR